MDERTIDVTRRVVETLTSALACDAPLHERRELVSAGVADLLAAVTDQSSSDIPRHEPLHVESLQATHLQAVLDAAFGVSLPLDDLADGVSVSAVADHLLADHLLEVSEPAATESAPEPVDRGGRFEPFSLTDVQQAYFFGRGQTHELGNIDAAFYVELATVDLDVGQFEHALRATVRRHDMLRAIVMPDGQQQVLPDVPDYTIVTDDLSGLPEPERQARLEALRTELTTKRRDVGGWPLFDVRATRLDEHRGLLHIGFDLLICDGASFARLLEELAARYADPDRPWPHLDLTFRDYLHEVERIEGEREERAKTYWMERLDSLPPAPELPLAKPLSAIDKPRFCRRHHALPRPSWEAFKARAAERGITPSSALATAYTEVLARWSRSAEFTINLTVNNRRQVHEQVPYVIGDFTTLTPLEVRSAAGAGFTEHAATLQRQLWRDLDHREFSGVRVMRELARRTMPGAAVIPVVFSTFVGAGFRDDFAPDWLAGIDYTLAQAPQLSLECLVMEHRGALNITWDTVDEAFPPGMLDDMFAAYQDLVERLAAGEEAWDAVAPVPLPAGQLAVRERVNQTAAPLPTALLHRLGPALAERRADAAVISRERVLSYADLDRLACRIGRRLRDSGAVPNQLVAVVMEKGWEQVAAVLGILYSGAAYLPIDASLPPDRIRRLLTRGEARFVLTQKAALDQLDWPSDVAVFAVDDDGLWTDTDTDDAPLEDVQTAGDLAYVIFTSGSTGEPKGVMIDHRGAANTVLDINSRFGVGPDDRVLGLSSLSFDLSVWDIFGVLAAGGALVLPEPEAGRDPERWRHLVTANDVTIWDTVPALMDMYVTYCEGQPTSDGLAPLRLVMMSGDWIDVALPQRIRARRSTPIQIISLGGATEASIWSIHHPIDAPDPSWKSVPYGTPLTNQTFHILEDSLRPRPDWVTGRLFIGGVGVARGYWRDPTRTSERFIINPHTGQRLYDTGDLGLYHPDGTIEFLGRDDGQVKINGYRIELGEVEHALTSHSQVDRAVALVAGNRLLSFVTTHPYTDTDLDRTAREQIAEWREVFDSLRAVSESETAGWTNSFTDRPIPDEDMRSWAEVSVRRILAQRPRRILEIGCGTGMMAMGLLPECVEYVGTDQSERHLEYLRGRIDQAGVSAKVRLLAREASDLTDIPQGHFDCVVINSVVQYFPSAEYVRQTVHGALAALRPGGVVYLGDVRDLRLLQAFHAAVERAHSSPDDPVRDVAWWLEQRGLTERELVIDPILFWAGLDARAAVLPRPGRGDNEMADYRYDVLLFRDAAEPITFSAQLDWLDHDQTTPQIRQSLERRIPTLCVRDIPNRRLLVDSAWVGSLHEPEVAHLPLADYTDLVTPDKPDGGRPLLLAEVARTHGYECEIFYRPDGPIGHFDAVFTSSAHDGVAATWTYATSDRVSVDPIEYINDPLAVRQISALPEQVRKHTTQILPSYMVPGDVVVLSTLPLTGNGKVDMKVLQAVAARRGQRSDAHADTGPRDAIERALATAWEQTLGTAVISVYHDFFTIGGDSLLAVRMVRAADEAGISVTVDDVFAYPTIAGLAERARSRQGAAEGGPAEAAWQPEVVPAPEDRYEPFPLTDLQQAYLLGRSGFFDLGNVAASFYVELEIGDLDPARLTTAVRGMIARHDMLRAVVGSDGQWRVLPEAQPYEIATRDLRHLDPDAAEAELAGIRGATSSRIFDPATCPLFEIAVSRLAGSWRLHVALDLLIADGGTVATFSTELAARYAEPGRSWPALELTFRDYNRAVAELEQSPRYRRARDYWLTRIADLPPAPRLPLVAAPADIVQPHFSRRTHRVDAAAWQRFRETAARHGITASMALATAYSEVLAAWAEEEPFTLNVTINNRLPVHDQIAEIVGDFTAVTLLQVDFRPTTAFSERARTLQQRLARDLDHSEFSGIRVLREIARRHGPERAGMAVVFTSALDSAGTDFGHALSGLGELVTGIVHTPQVHLDHQVFEYGGQLVLNWDSVDELFDAAALDEMFTSYVALVERLAEIPTWDVAGTRPTMRRAQGAVAASPTPSATTAEMPSSTDRDASVRDARTEQTMTEIWHQVLGLEHIDPHAEFSRLGGDSLMALQVINKAAAAGLVITPREFFANQTIAALAAVARPAEPSAAQIRSGSVPILPRQAALLAEWAHPERHNYVLLFDVANRLEETALKVALRTVLRHHDGLRLFFESEESGWTAQVAEPADLVMPLEWVDLTGTPERECAQAISETSERLQRSLQLNAAPLFRVVYFQRSGGQQLLIVINQLITDNYSCRVFCEDLLSAHDQVATTGEAVLPPAASVVTWAEHVRSLAADPAVRGEEPYWRQLALRRTPTSPVAADMADTALIALEPRVTSALQEANATPDFLVAAVARAIARRTNEDVVRVDLDGHGRDLDSATLSPARIIGRLSVRWPLEIPVALDLPLDDAAKAVAGIRSRTPAGGRHYELFAQFIDPAVRVAPASVVVNYLGHADALWTPLGLSLSPDHPGLLPTADEPDNERLNILAGVVAGHLLIACTPGTAGLLEEIGHEMSGQVLGGPASLAVPPEAETLRQWLGHG